VRGNQLIQAVSLGSYTVRPLGRLTSQFGYPVGYHWLPLLTAEHPGWLHASCTAIMLAAHARVTLS
jgi:hypothetical protein